MASILSWMKETREYLTPVLTTSSFIEKGILTPEEFVRAGDQLVHTCPTWKWQSGERGSRKSYLPADKQYLSTAGVNCYRRIAHLKQNTVDVDVDGGLAGDANEAWCAPEIKLQDEDEDDDGDAVMISADDLISDGKAPSTKTYSSRTLVEEDFEDESLSIDAYAISSSSARSGAGAKDALDASVDESTKYCDILKSRKYDMSITYDNYYRTPRIWLFGYEEDGSVLEPRKVFQDIMSDYANKTVTFENHPHMSRRHATVHPCQHAPAMLRIIVSLIDAGKVPAVEQYMFIFLKFIQSVIPTIEYDFTSDVDTGR